MAREAAEKEAARLRELERIENERRAAMAKELEATNIKLLEEKNHLFTELQNLKEIAGNSETMITKLNGQKAELESHLNNLEDKLLQEESEKSELNLKKKKLEAQIEDLKQLEEEFLKAIK